MKKAIIKLIIGITIPIWFFPVFIYYIGDTFYDMYFDKKEKSTE